MNDSRSASIDPRPLIWLQLPSAASSRSLYLAFRNVIACTHSRYTCGPQSSETMGSRTSARIPSESINPQSSFDCLLEDECLQSSRQPISSLLRAHYIGSRHSSGCGCVVGRRQNCKQPQRYEQSGILPSCGIQASL